MSNQVTQIIAAVREAAAERPDHVYVRAPLGRCQYVDRNGEIHPGCLVGHGFWRRGLIGPSFIDASTNRLGVDVLMSDLHLDPSAAQGIWLNCVQAYQDGGYTWGNAVSSADAEALALFYGNTDTPESRRRELALPVAVAS